MGVGNFTDKERLVFYNILKYPDYGDKQISEVTGVKPSTVTAIRRRLKEDGLFRTVMVPAMNRIGFELITVSYGRFSPTADRKAKEAFFKKVKEDKNVFYALEGGDIVLLMSFARNYSEVKKTIDSYIFFFNSHNLSSNGDWRFLLFPFEVSKLISYFHYHHIFAQLYDVEDSIEVDDITYEDCTLYHLSRKEKQCLYAMVKYPQDTDIDIAKKAGLSRQGYANIRSRFMENGLIHKHNVLNLQKLGMDILAISYSRFNPRRPLRERSQGIRKIMEATPEFLMLSGNFENIMLGVFKDYEHYNRVKLNAVRIYQQHDFLRGEPEISLIPLQSARVIKDLTFSQVLEDLLDTARDE